VMFGPKEQAAVDQSLRLLAELLHTYYQELRALGFDDPQAMLFAVNYQNMLLSQSKGKE